MKIAVIGTGRIGKTLGTLWAENGHTVYFGSRNAGTAETLAREVGHDAQGGGILDSAEFCDVALLAVPWYAFTDIERAVGTALDGKIIIDCMNPLRSTGSLALGHKWSAGEEVQKIFHRARVVKAFNHIYWSTFENPQFDEGAASLFYCSNYDDAKNVVIELATEMGFEPVDSGPIKNARLLEPLAALWMQLAFVTHQGADSAFRLVRRSV